MTSRKYSDEFYVIDICDEILGIKASRQHTFDILRGDGTPGRKLPVDAYYSELNLVIEYRERQHSESIAFFNKNTTISGVSRDEQRRIYDQRRRDILPKHGIRLVEISFSDLKHDSRKRLIRDRQNDIAAIRQTLQQNGVIPTSSAPLSTTANEKPKIKNNKQTWLYRIYRKFGCLFIFAVITITAFLSCYLSICIFHLDEPMSYIVAITILFIVSFILHHYTSAVDQRLRSNPNRYNASPSTYSNADRFPVCCPQCGSHNIGPTDNGDFVCIDCGIRWTQTFDY